MMRSGERRKIRRHKTQEKIRTYHWHFMMRGGERHKIRRHKTQEKIRTYHWHFMMRGGERHKIRRHKKRYRFPSVFRCAGRPKIATTVWLFQSCVFCLGVLCLLQPFPMTKLLKPCFTRASAGRMARPSKTKAGLSMRPWMRGRSRVRNSSHSVRVARAWAPLAAW